MDQAMIFCRLGFAAALVLLIGSSHAFAQQDDGRRDYQEESRQVYRLSRTFSDATRDELAALQPVLTSDELLDLLALRSEDSCKRWIVEYWRSHDPLLTTAENEARIEHERRVGIARDRFARE